MEKWIKRGTYTNIEEYIKELHGMSFQEFVTLNRNYEIPDMNKVVNVLYWAKQNSVHIDIVGDYDSDGINSVYCLIMILSYLAISDYSIYMPKRITEGYGFSLKILERMKPNGILICIDNGIASLDAIEQAKKMGKYVIILDHHESVKDKDENVSLPNADIIIDPTIQKNNEYHHYCGAGLAFKLAELIIPSYHPYYGRIISAAAVGTIGDLVPLTGDNRKIVKEGLKYLKTENCSQGYQSLINLNGLDCNLTEEDIAFKIVPCLNACGRLEDAGSLKALSCIFSEDQEKSKEMAEILLELNSKRKEIVKTVIENIGDLSLENPIVQYIPNIPEGILGNIAGDIMEKTKKAVFIFTDSLEEGLLKGSARCCLPNTNLKNQLDKSQNLIEKYGGHEGAAGLSIKKDNFEIFKKRMEECFSSFIPDTNQYYDLEIQEEEIETILEQLKSIRPFGTDNKNPIIKVTLQLGDKKGKKISVMGSNKNHIKFHALKCNAVGFSMIDKINFDLEKDKEKIDKIEKVTLIGTLLENTYKSFTSPQFNMIDFIIQ